MAVLILQHRLLHQCYTLGWYHGSVILIEMWSAIVMVLRNLSHWVRNLVSYLGRRGALHRVYLIRVHRAATRVRYVHEDCLFLWLLLMISTHI